MVDPEREFHEKAMIDAYLTIEDAMRAGWTRAEEFAPSMPGPIAKMFRVRIAQCAGELLDALFDFVGEGFTSADRAVAILANTRPTHGDWNAVFPGIPLEHDEVNNPDWVAGFLFGLAMPGEFDKFMQMSVDHHQKREQERNEES